MSSRKATCAAVDEQHEIAGLAEIRLRGEQRDRSEPVVAVARHGRGGDGEQRAAQTIAGRMNLAAGHDGVDDVERRHHAVRAIIVQGNIAILGCRVCARRS